MTFSRRRILQGATAVVAMPSIVTSARAQARSIVIRDIGVGTSFADAYGKAFKEATGIEVTPVTAQHEPVGLIKQMVDAKAYTWDAAIVSRQAANQLAADGGGYLEPLNVEAADGWKALPDIFKTPTFAGNDVVASVLAYRTDKIKTPPKSWADFADTTKIPGRRAMRKFPFDTIEQALMADGVPPGKLFPLDFDRAYKRLDAMKKDISVWWTSGAQSGQLIQSGEVDLCTTWNGRAQSAINAGAPVGIMWEQSLWGVEGWVILKGTPKADLVREFIKFALDGGRQAIFSKATGYGPTLPDAITKLEPAIARTMPTHPDNSKSSTVVDDVFWAKNRDAQVERFNKWVAA